MAVPVDYQQFWTQGNKGFSDAMPHLNKAIQDGKPGSPTVEAYLREWEDRVARGENPKVVSDDMTLRFENDVKGGAQQRDVNVPSPGFNQDTPALGEAGVPMKPIAQAPNSFGGGSFSGLTPPASQMGGGVTGNAAPSTPVPAPAAQQWGTPIPTNSPTQTFQQPVIDNPQEKVVQVPSSPVDDNPIPYSSGMPPKDNIDLLKRPMNDMQTKNNPNQSTYSIRSRGEQEQALADKARMDKMDSSGNTLEFKRDELEAKSKISILKAMSKRLTDKEKMDLQRTLGEAGMTLKAKIAVMDATIRMKNAEGLKATRDEANRIKAKNSGEGLSPKLKHMWDVFKEAKSRLAQYENSMGKRKNAAEIARLQHERNNALYVYNKSRIDEGLDYYQDEGYNTPVEPEGVTDPGED